MGRMRVERIRSVDDDDEEAVDDEEEDVAVDLGCGFPCGLFEAGLGVTAGATQMRQKTDWRRVMAGRVERRVAPGEDEETSVGKKLA